MLRYMQNLPLEIVNNILIIQYEEQLKEKIKETETLEKKLKSLEFNLRDLQHNSLKKGTDQTPVNYLAVEHFGKDINYLSKKFNWCHLHTTHGFSQCILTGKPIFIQYGYIWHFNGLPRDQRDSYMKQTWDMIKENYED